jgi:hypothetical protein
MKEYGMKTTKWRVYCDLAWTESIVTSPEEYIEETELFKLEIHTDYHIIGLFKLETWLDLLKEVGLEVKQMKMEHSYDRFILGEGEYSLLMFICSKPL